MLTFGSIILAAASLLGVGLTAHGIRSGWAWQAAIQVPYAAFDILTAQWGFLAMGIVFAWLYTTGWRRLDPTASKRSIPPLPQPPTGAPPPTRETAETRHAAAR